MTRRRRRSLEKTMARTAREVQSGRWYCRPEQEVYLAEEGIIDDFLNCWTSSDQQRDVMIETSKKEEPSIFETDHLCMYADDEKPLEDMFMQVAE